ncbi:hypothetical protein MHU86_11946 [Fragilaria crotonensis]|nr:hypothetical protein MHU86_11946 [Fragilaria crotonensis]
MQSHHLNRYSEAQQRDINLVRLYLQVNTLAEMVDPTRPSAINLDYLDGIRASDWQSHSEWPRQAPPSSRQRRLWKRFVSSSYLRYIPYWKSSPGGPNNSILQQQQHPTSWVPSKEPAAPPHSFDSLKAYMRTLNRSQARMVSGVEQLVPDVQLWRAMRSRARLHIASDGGLQGQQGTFGWVLATNKCHLAQGSGPVDGPSDTLSSTRCEMAGFASSLLFIVSLARHWGIHHRCKFTWITDSKAAIAKIRKMCRRNCSPHRQPFDADLLSLIRSLLKELRRSVAFKWTKGHLDTTIEYAKLPYAAKLNIRADILATRYRQRGRLKSSSHVDHYSEQQVSLLVNGTRLTSQFDESLRFHINGYHLRQYVQRRNKWDDRTWEDIDMELFGSHFKKLPCNDQIQHMKFVFNQLPLGWRRLHRSASEDQGLQLCPCCLRQKETSEHFLRCPNNPSILKERLALLRDTNEHTPHPIRRLLHDGLSFWQSTGSSEFSPDLTQFPLHMQAQVRLTAKRQTSIGWDNAAKGYLSKEWHGLAALHTFDPKRLESDLAAKRMKNLVKDLQAYTKHLWKSRNEILHSATNAEMDKIRSTTQSEIRHFYAHPDLIQREDNYLFRLPLTGLLSSNRSTQDRWIHRVKASAKRNQKESNNQSLITQFFPHDNDQICHSSSLNTKISHSVSIEANTSSREL